MFTWTVEGCLALVYVLLNVSTSTGSVAFIDTFQSTMGHASLQSTVCTLCCELSALCVFHRQQHTPSEAGVVMTHSHCGEEGTCDIQSVPHSLAVSLWP